MGVPSKERDVLKLFFNNTARHWHFEEILKQTKLSRSKVSKWVNKALKKNIIKKIKPRKRMPFYIGNFNHPAYQNRKRLYAFTKFYQTGFLDHLISLPKAKTVIIFGSMSRWDWHSESDIDVFIYGSSQGLERGTYRRKLHRQIQTFVCKNKEELSKFEPPLLRNILEGYCIKGALNFIEVKAYA